MKQIISIIQQKGGVGKTTLTVHLAHELRAQNPTWRIAIADADPQQSATKWVARGKLSQDVGIDAYTVAADGEGKHLRKELEAIDADVDHHSARLHPVRLHHLRAPDGDDEDVGATRVRSQIACAAMAQGHGRVGVGEQRSHRTTHDAASPDHYRVLPVAVDAVLLKDTHDPRRGARRDGVQA